MTPPAPAATAYFRTFGCQMNEHDSARMAALLQRRGYRLVTDPAQADVVVVNTCEVRDKADQKMLSEVGRLREGKQLRPRQVVVVAGCGAQLRGADLLQRAGHVDLVLGPDQILQLPELIDRVRAQRERLVAVDWWSGAGDDPAARAADERAAGVSTFVTAMTGCDNHCSYCIVPTTRGAERSRPLEHIVAEVCGLAAQGVREVTLLGQCVNAYGRGLSPTTRFDALLRAVAAVPGILRIRFMTSHPRHVDPELVRAFSEVPEIASHLHLPVQAGSDRVLRQMGRGYLRAEVEDRIAQLRLARPDLSLTTDLIVGFPGETEEDFQETLALVRAIGFDAIFSFAFSPRPGTPAASFAPQVPPPVRAERLARLAEIQAPFTQRALHRAVGRDVEVLVEGDSARGGPTKMGRTSQNVVVNFDGAATVGALVTVRITEAKANTLFGEVQAQR